MPNQPVNLPREGRTLRVLSLHAGGIRTLYTIRVLKRLMAEFDKTRPPTEGKSQPCDVFDMIGGVETGGLLALMLGRLQISLDDCETKFKYLCEKIYQPRRQNQSRQELTSEVFLPAVKEICGGQYSTEMVRLRNTYISCRVCVILKCSESGPYSWDILSTYTRDVEDVSHPNRKDADVWRVAAATTATVGQFEPQLLSEFAEGLGSWHPDRSLADPVDFVAREVKAEFPGVGALFINIGSGVSDRRWTQLTSTNNFFRDNPKVVEGEISINHTQLLGRFPAYSFSNWNEMEDKVTNFMSRDDINQEIVEYARKLSEACPPQI
ncbi:hypothetical protein JMJ35_010516 [Cladonia borealis]|uniref:PNPLA domain-containing protein n=1 Tax=Cladonia borealis TaxID=184061 RepID=A0AA39UX26_9LECA|nr:hypothetical protein JMJ35_010516 [Cladonia borealis]